MLTDKIKVRIEAIVDLFVSEKKKFTSVILRDTLTTRFVGITDFNINDIDDYLIELSKSSSLFDDYNVFPKSPPILYSTFAPRSG